MPSQITHEAVFEISKKSQKLTDKHKMKICINILLKAEPEADIYNGIITKKYVRILWYSKLEK